MENLSSLKQNIELLVAQVQQLKKTNRELVARSVAADARAHNAEQQNQELQQQMTQLLLNSSITEISGGTRLAKLRIKRLLRDIDRCIALSSKQ